MKLLAFDTSAAACSAMVSVNGVLKSTRSEKMNRGQSERLIPLIEEVLADANITTKELDVIATTVGPGAFTGIRIGLATARALGLALNIPVVGITTTLAVAMASANENTLPIAVVIESKRADLYVDFLSADGVSENGPQAMAPENILNLLKAQKFLCVGDGVPRLLPMLKESDIECQLASGDQLPDPSVIAMLALADIENKGLAYFDNPPQPLYIRPPDVSPPKPNPRASL